MKAQSTFQAIELPVVGVFDEAEVIHSYSRREALEDGFQVDANIGDFAEVSRSHFKYPVFMTREVYSLIEKAVASKHGNDFAGVWHDILYMSKVYYKDIDPSRRLFQVKITGAGRKSIFTMIAEVGPKDIDDASPAVTISMRG